MIAPAQASRRLLVISPCRDEERFVELTLRSVVAQTRRPERWIIVDDGSRDSTPDIVSTLAKDHPWIELVRRQRDGGRQLGPGVVSAFNAGLARAGNDPFDVVAKLDCDLEFGPDCFERILAHFDDPRVGMASGTTFLKTGSSLVSERHPPFQVPGQAKFYRRQCFAAIGGLRPLYGWDILDETDARRHGWVTLSDAGIILIHHRLRGQTFGQLRGRVIWGWGAYAIGSHPLFAVARGIYRMAETPWIVGGLAFLWGYFSSYFRPGLARTPDREFIRHLRREQLHRLFHGNRLPLQGPS
jgi:biofilm PGA synthesis N-glycosyltransferase PgaC